MSSALYMLTQFETLRIVEYLFKDIYLKSNETNISAVICLACLSFRHSTTSSE